MSIYRTEAEKLEKLGFHDSAKALRVLVESCEAHRDILNDIIYRLRQKIQIEEIMKKK